MPVLAESVTPVPAQKVVGPDVVIEAAGKLSAVTVTGLLNLAQPLVLVTRTRYPPAVDVLRVWLVAPATGKEPRYHW